MATYKIIRIGDKYQIKRKFFFFWEDIFTDPWGHCPHKFNSSREAEEAIETLHPITEIVKEIKK
jgi:hypothetical protein